MRISRSSVIAWSRRTVTGPLVRSQLTSPAVRRWYLRSLGLDIGNATIASGVRVVGSSLSIADGARIGRGVLLDATAPIRIEAGATIGANARLRTSRSVSDSEGNDVRGLVYASPIIVREGAFVAEGSTIDGGRLIEGDEC